ncbi:hypothetical protein [Caviibacter abscessus]|uniref:hypothetical protein n=1 Tax=Caviibacter abscessus TaxID=1766719 RepID=UPI00082EDE01|nr:hypothetical protein [Caviibacter abscessus]
MKKKIFIVLTLTTNLLFAVNDKEIKANANVGLVRDSAVVVKVKWLIYKEATLERYTMSGELQEKFLKSFSLKENIKIKLREGSSICATCYRINSNEG